MTDDLRPIGKGKHGDRYRQIRRVGDAPTTSKIPLGLPLDPSKLDYGAALSERISLGPIRYDHPIPGFKARTKRLTKEYRAEELERNAQTRQELQESINGFEALLRRTEAGIVGNVEDDTILDALFKTAVISFRECYKDDPPDCLKTARGGLDFFAEMTAIRNGYAAHSYGALRQSMAHVTCMELSGDRLKPHIVAVGLTSSGTPRPVYIREYLKHVRRCLAEETRIQLAMGRQVLQTLLEADQASLHALPDPISPEVKTSDAGRSQNQIDKGLHQKRR